MTEKQPRFLLITADLQVQLLPSPPSTCEGGVSSFSLAEMSLLLKGWRIQRLNGLLPFFVSNLSVAILA